MSLCVTLVQRYFRLCFLNFFGPCGPFPLGILMSPYHFLFNHLPKILEKV